MSAPEQASTSTTIATLKPQRTSTDVRAGFFNLEGFELLQRVAKAFATSSLVPKEYQGNIANCMIALNLANRLRADELMVMQNLYIVHGRPGWSSKYLIATFNECGRFSTVKYEWFGEKGTDSWGARAWAIELATKERIVGPDITIQMAKDEGWFQKNGSKWKTIPQLMLMYRSAGWMINTSAPEISMGFSTEEELRDIIDINSDGSYTVNTEPVTVGSLRDVDQETGEVQQLQSNASQTLAGATTRRADPVTQNTSESGDEPRAKASTVAGSTSDSSSQAVQAQDGNNVVLTYAQVNDAMSKADSVETLEVAIAMIADVESPEQQDELRSISRELLKKFATPDAAKSTNKRTTKPADTSVGME